MRHYMNKKIIIFILTCLLPIISTAASALIVNDNRPDPAKVIAEAHANPGENAETDTRNAELADSDDKLNETYQKIMSQLDKKQQAALKEAQKAWIKMRDADCRWAFSDIRDCLMDRIDNREKELKTTWFGAKNGDYTSLEEIRK